MRYVNEVIHNFNNMWSPCNITLITSNLKVHVCNLKLSIGKYIEGITSKFGKLNLIKRLDLLSLTGALLKTWNFWTKAKRTINW